MGAPPNAFGPTPAERGLQEPVAPLEGGGSPGRQHSRREVCPGSRSYLPEAHPPTGVLVLWPETATRIPPSLPYWLGGSERVEQTPPSWWSTGREVSRRAKAFLIPGVERLPGHLVRMRDLLYRKAGVPVPESFDLERGQPRSLGPLWGSDLLRGLPTQGNSGLGSPRGPGSCGTQQREHVSMAPPQGQAPQGGPAQGRRNGALLLEG